MDIVLRFKWLVIFLIFYQRLEKLDLWLLVSSSTLRLPPTVHMACGKGSVAGHCIYHVWRRRRSGIMWHYLESRQSFETSGVEALECNTNLKRQSTFLLLIFIFIIYLIFLVKLLNKYSTSIQYSGLTDFYPGNLTFL